MKEFGILGIIREQLFGNWTKTTAQHSENRNVVQRYQTIKSANYLPILALYRQE